MMGGERGEEWVVRPVDDSDRNWLRERLAERWAGPEVVVLGRLLRADLLPGLVAVDKAGLVAGVLTYRVEGSVCRVITLDAYSRGQGVGTQLLEAVGELARNARCGTLSVVTTNDNLAALRFYQRRGFRLVAAHAGSLAAARRLKPGMPPEGVDGIPLRDEVELALDLEATEDSPAAPGWVLYMVRCADGSLYTGITNDLARRLDEHNRGDGARYTRGRGPVELVYAEAAEDRSAASVREAQVKRLSRAAKFSLITG